MKLRNKRTGEIETVICSFYYESDNGEMNEEIEMEVSSLAELSEDWEDYVPKEPLIKDEKIRKAVRAWAEENNVTAIWVDYEDQLHSDLKLNKRNHYTITELCGEEE